MKKIISIFGFVASATVLFTNCTRSLDVQSPESNQFSLIAVTEAPKTANDSLSTKWVALDSINVFHALTGTTTYGSNDPFGTSEAGISTGTFTGDLTEALDPSQSYDWYALYPYSGFISTPANPTAGYLNIGSKKASAAQVQFGNNSKAHLAGKYFPLYAKSTNVSGNDKVVLSFKNALSVVRIHVTNSISKPVTITNISMTATQNIIGSYYIDFSDSLPKFTPSGDNFVSKTAQLNVEDAEAIPVSSSADFYLAIKPFENAATDSIKISVNGVTKSFASAVSFAPGVIKTINFNLDQQPETYYTFDLSKNTPNIAIADSLAWTNLTEYCTMSIVKNSSGTDCINYYPGTASKSYTSTRAYSGMIMKITPASGYQMKRIVIETTSDGYATALAGCTWTNASASADKMIVTVTPQKLAGQVKVLFNTTVGMTSVKVFYEDEVFIPVTGVSLNQTTASIKTGESVTLVPTISPENASNKEVTWSSSEPTVATVENGVVTPVAAGNATITVKTVDGEFTATCVVTVSAGDPYFEIKSSDIVSNSTYTAYTKAISERNWLITFGGNSKSVGTNSGNRSKCILGSTYSKYAIEGDVATTDVASAYACLTKIENVKKISYTFNGGSGQASTKVYLIYSTDGTTFNKMTLTKGTQGATISSGTEYEFAKCSGYFALVFKATNSTGNWRIDSVNLKFTYEETK